ncbi:hypothetical protein CMV_027913 [Castanea mollissima]|uniref:Uncharacterized protein n=1 Tax=Castanea mollissima TaxID=60419 RepID=A0A8J4Q9L2_9ROSI|nr:hypothetical protein CMV_027913 [Castanea mollissima]
MASSTLYQNLPFLLKPVNPLYTTRPRPRPTGATTTTAYVAIRCGPRSNRGPLMKGRILSIEAINAIQTLKRAHKSSSTTPDYSPILSRLLKADLLATLRELLRQDHCALALHAFSAVRSEYHNPDLSLYADVAAALARNRMVEDLDRLICDLETDCGGGGIQCDDKGLIRLIKAVIGADRRESTVRIYEMMKRSGWGSTFEADEYVVKVLSKGLRRLGEESLAVEVKGLSRANLEKLSV